MNAASIGRTTCASLLLLATSIGAEPAQAQALGRFLSCNDIPRAEERLQCYDSAARLVLGLGPSQSRPAQTPGNADASIAARELAAQKKERELALREAALDKRSSAKASDPSRSSNDDLAAKDAEIKALQEKIASLSRVTATTEEQATLFGIPIPFTRNDPMKQMETLPNQNVERGEDGEIEAIEVALREWSTAADGMQIFVLENGQVWRQTSGEAPYLNPQPKTPHIARVARGAIGSFNMTFKGSNKVMKVRRVDGKKSKK